MANKCQKCGINPVHIHDKKYNQDLCEIDWNQRKVETLKVSDYEWWDANGLIATASPEELNKLGA